LVDSDDDLIWVMDLRSESIVYVNDAYARVWNSSPADLFSWSSRMAALH